LHFVTARQFDEKHCNPHSCHCCFPVAMVTACFVDRQVRPEPLLQGMIAGAACCSAFP